LSLLTLSAVLCSSALPLHAALPIFAAVEAKIAAACARAGRKRDDVTLVAVTKTFPAAAVDYAVAAGTTDVGENRVIDRRRGEGLDRKSTRLNSSHVAISYAVFCLKK